MTKNFNQLKPELLAISKRGHSVENMHYGWICVINKNKKVVYSKGEIKDKVFLRSAAKPVQAISALDNNIDLSKKELAVICASHPGSKAHLTLLKKIMKRYKLHPSFLKCGLHLPFDKIERKRLLKNSILPNVLHNNCSGKHIGMLIVCIKNNWSIKNYLSPNHPIQKSILKNIKMLSETKNISIGIDGCGAPTFSLPVINIAKMFSNFTNFTNLKNPNSKKYSKIIKAMSENPYLAGGTKQFESEIMKKSYGNLISKGGAEGIIFAAKDGNCAVLKIADGSQTVRSFVFLKLLLKLGWLKKSKLKRSFLREILTGNMKNHAGKTVGKIHAFL